MLLPCAPSLHLDIKFTRATYTRAVVRFVFSVHNRELRSVSCLSSAALCEFKSEKVKNHTANCSLPMFLPTHLHCSFHNFFLKCKNLKQKRTKSILFIIISSSSNKHYGPWLKTTTNSCPAINWADLYFESSATGCNVWANEQADSISSNLHRWAFWHSCLYRPDRDVSPTASDASASCTHSSRPPCLQGLHLKQSTGVLAAFRTCNLTPCAPCAPRSLDTLQSG